MVSECLLIQEVLRFPGVDLPLVLQMDAPAAIGICRRQLVGNIRHLSTKFLWVQQLVLEKKLSVEKLAGELNGADIGAKVLDKRRLQECMRLIGMRGEALDNEGAVDVRAVAASPVVTMGGGSSSKRCLVEAAMGLLLAACGARSEPHCEMPREDPRIRRTLGRPRTSATSPSWPCCPWSSVLGPSQVGPSEGRSASGR